MSNTESQSPMRADGSAIVDDQRPTVEVDRDDEPYRWRCPNGHTSWDRTNNHVWCPSCRRALEGDAILNERKAEHYEIVDARSDQTIPFEVVEFAGEL